MIEKIVQHKNCVEFDSEPPPSPSKRCNGLLTCLGRYQYPEKFLYLGTPFTLSHTFSIKLQLLSIKT